MKNGILKYMNAKKVIFTFFAFTFFISGNVFAAGAVIYTQPYQHDANGNLIPQGIGQDGKPRFAEACGPCAVLDRAMYERDANGKIVRDLMDLSGITVTDRVPESERSRIQGVPSLVLPGVANPIVGPNPIISRAQAYVAQQPQKPKPPTSVPVPKPKPTTNKPSTTPTKPPSIPVPKEQLPNEVFTQRMKCALNKKGAYECQLFNIDGTPVVDGDGIAQQITVFPNEPLFAAIAGNQPGTDFWRSPNSTPPAVRPLPADGSHLSQLPNTLPPVPGDPGYVPPAGKVPRVPPGLSLIPVKPSKAVRYVYTLKSFPRVPGPTKIGGDDYEIIIEKCGFDVEGKSTGCEDMPPVKITRVSTSIQAETTGLSMAAELNKKEPKAATPPPTTPKPSGKPTISITPPTAPKPPKYSYQIGKPALANGVYTMRVTVSECSADKDGVETCKKVSSFDVEVDNITGSDAAQKAFDFLDNNLKANGIPPEYLPKPPAKAGAVITPPKGTPLTPAQKAEYERKIAKEEADAAALKAQIDALPKP